MYELSDGPVERKKHQGLKSELRPLQTGKVYPSKEITVFAIVHENDIYGGAHRYEFTNCKGFNNGQTEYDEHYYSKQELQFVHKADDGTITPGLQSEQLLLALIDRTKKLNERFPCRENSIAITKMEEALFWFQKRVQDRIDRDVMGERKN